MKDTTSETDPIPSTTTARTAVSATGTPALWVLLVLSAICNAATSIAGVNSFVSSSFGLVTLACGIVLVIRRRNRR
jgi:hypothetical protein